jgi:hypothetical protein
MDEKMLKAGGDVKRRELNKQFEDLSLDQYDRTKMNEEEEYKAVKGDKNQAERLLAAKKRGY